MQFKNFASKVRGQFAKMAKGNLFVVDISKDGIWEMYMNAFPEGTNIITNERREYDCQYCKQFIRRVGNVVAIVDGKLVSVWDVIAEEYYNDVAKIMSNNVKSSTIKDVFLLNERVVGIHHNIQELADGSVITWNHFSCELPSKFVSNDVATKKGGVSQALGVFSRGLEELTLESLQTVSELIAQKSIYRGDEFKNNVADFIKLKVAYDKLKDVKAKNIFVWSSSKNRNIKFKNSVIGTLVEDISKGVELDKAVASFESKVAPSNYKRTSSVVTKGMIEGAVKEIDKLGIEASLHRRYATIEDITINNVLFADREASGAMKGGLLDELLGDVKNTPKTFEGISEITIDDFITDVLPNITTMEMYVANKNAGNFVSLIAPKDPEAPSILKWDNNFTWSYSGEVADSMKERVKAAGGKVDGVLRFSIQWNEEGEDMRSDLDAHCAGPGGHIMYSSKHDYCGGKLDVDITKPGARTAVENITWQNLSKMRTGNYKFYVNNFSGRNTKGFRAQIEMDGVIHDFDYPSSVGSDVVVGEVTLKGGKFTLKSSLGSTTSSKEIWGVQTEDFVKVEAMMMSPNHWDEQEVGNKHYMFMLNGCKNPDDTRGLYNEFLKNDLMKHRKVFDLLGSKFKCEHSDSQLSGLGFSNTKRDDVIVKVSGTFNRTLKIKF